MKDRYQITVMKSPSVFLKTLAAMVMLLLAIVITLKTNALPPEQNVFATFGSQLADEVAHFSGPSKVAILSTLNAQQHESSALMLERFSERLRKQNIDVLGTVEIQVNSHGDTAFLDFVAPASLYEDIAARYPDAEWIISFVGPPENDVFISGDASAPGIILAGVLSDSVGLNQYFRDQVIHMAFLKKPADNVLQAKHQDFSYGWLRRHFDVVTVDNYKSYLDRL